MRPPGAGGGCLTGVPSAALPSRRGPGLGPFGDSGQHDLPASRTAAAHFVIFRNFPDFNPRPAQIGFDALKFDLLTFPQFSGQIKMDKLTIWHLRFASSQFSFEYSFRKSKNYNLVIVPPNDRSRKIIISRVLQNDDDLIVSNLMIKIIKFIL